MELSGIPFETTDWSRIEPTEHPGETGMALWRTRQFGDAPRPHGRVHAPATWPTTGARRATSCSASRES